MTPIVDGLAEKYQAEVVTKRINANEGEGPGIMRAYGVRGHPTVLIFDRQGQEAGRFTGPQPAETIEKILEESLKSSSRNGNPLPTRSGYIGDY